MKTIENTKNANEIENHNHQLNQNNENTQAKLQQSRT